MVRKIESITQVVSEKLKSIPAVDCILLQEPCGDNYSDPYFFISLDVYYRGAIPDAKEREVLMGDVGAFESSFFSPKDRFFMLDVPVRVEYKHKDRVDHIMQNTEGNFWAFRSTGTYMFYRLENGKVVLQKTSWINGVKAKLKEFSPRFWTSIRNAAFASMEHQVIDLTSAVINGDDFFYAVSLSGYLKSLSTFLFAVNRKFEPSRRGLSDKILKLPKLPENFAGRFDSLIREDGSFSRKKRQEVAQLLTKSLLHLE